MKLGIAFDRLRWEEKALKDEADALGVEASLVDAKGLIFDISKNSGPLIGDAVLQRCISHYRALFLARMLEGQGVNVINPYSVAELCGNKLATTMALSKAGVPTPRTRVALSSEMVEKAAEDLGFPVVLKPFTGSWGRMVHVVRDRPTLQALVELREELPNPIDHMYYVQEYIKRPPRDIRAVVAGDEIVASVYRYAPEGDFRTNVARGGTSKAFDADQSLQEMILKAARVVGGGVLGVDAMESPSGYVVHEVNNTVEFKGAQSAVEWSIPKKVVEYVIGTVRS
ncbi:MAG TPA: lysine biosynthesis protein LysX [Nitrososphaerales archaeon]|nr:lysine biosynthesis protein LysX [Nitrososphaerales archaeon]